MTRLSLHLSAISVLVTCALILHSDFATQRFYSDDFMFLLDSRDWSPGQFAADLFASPEASSWNYWRPGLRIALAAVYGVFGLNDAAYMVLGFGVHLFAAGLVYGFVFTSTRSVLFALVAGFWLVSAPAAVESFTWVVCSFGVLPASVLVFAAGWCLIAAFACDRSELIGGSGFGGGGVGRDGPGGSLSGGVQTRKQRLYWLAVALTAGSLTFREPAYQMPFVVLGISWLHDRSLRLALVRSLPFAVLTAIHFLWLNAASPEGAGASALVWTSLRNQALMIRAVSGIGGSDALVLSGFLALSAFGFWLADVRGRCMIWWSLFACLPYVAKAAADRHSYVFHLCLATSLALVLARVTRARPRGRVLAIVTFSGLCVVHVLRLPAAQEAQRSMGRQCESILEWSRGQDLGRFDLLMPDVVPQGIENGWSAMLALYLGIDVDVYPNNSLPRPPFQILFHKVPVGDANVAYLHLDAATKVYSIVPRSAMFGDRVIVPILSVIDRYEVASPVEALSRLVKREVDPAATVLVETAPFVAFEPTGGSRVLSSRGWPHVEIEVDAKGPCYLVICLPVRLADGSMEVTVDGKLVTPVAANGFFDAVLLQAGRHQIVLD